MPAPPPQTPPTPRLHLNWQEWLPYISECNASVDEKRELIETMWSIARAFVDLGWEVDFVAENGGEGFDLCAALHAAVVYSKEPEIVKEEV